MAAVQAIVEDRFTVPRPFTAGSVTAEKHRGGDAAAERMRALLEEADELYEQSLAGVVFDQPYEGTATAELHTAWDSMMATLSAEQVRAQEERAQQKRSGVKVRIPKPPRTAEGRHRHHAGANSSAHGPLGGIPGPPAPTPHPEGEFGDGTPGSSRASARLGGRRRPTSEGVTMLHQLDAHTDLYLAEQLAAANVAAKKAAAGAGGAPIGPIPRPLAAQAALDALSRPPRSPRDPLPPHQSHRPASRGGSAAATSLVRTQLGAAAPPSSPSVAPFGGGSVAIRISSFQCAREAAAATKRPPRASAAPARRPAHGGRPLDGRPRHSPAPPAHASAGSPGPASAAAALGADATAPSPSSSSYHAAPSPAMAASNPPQIVPLSARTFAPPPPPPPPPLTHPPAAAVPLSEPHPPPAGAPIVAAPTASLAPSPAKHARSLHGGRPSSTPSRSYRRRRRHGTPRRRPRRRGSQRRRRLLPAHERRALLASLLPRNAPGVSGGP